ncbi:hypothetical protein [Cohnella thermotolerans]|uniref:hypothetical protein n=1 Tax=Cohnella thermotolerans TaxID=329858 RepID=UPI0004290252|nr:hypothetical protein [Cohnella thermotolerans]
MKLVENDHVGNEWYTAAYANGKTIAKGSSVAFNLKSTDSVSLKAYAGSPWRRMRLFCAAAPSFRCAGSDFPALSSS